MYRKHNELHNAERIHKSAALLLLALMLVAGSLAAPKRVSAGGPDGNEIDNWSLEDFRDPYDSFTNDADDEYDLRVAEDWNRYSQTSSGHEVYFMDDQDYTDCFDTDSHLTEGDTAQSFWSYYGFNAGIYQKNVSVTSNRPYGVKAAILSAIGSNAPSNAKIIVRVGIDPNGGTNPYSSSVIWGEPDETARDDKDDWNDVRAAAVSNNSNITVFISATNVTDVKASKRYAVWVDAVVAERAPSCTITTPSSTTSSSFTVKVNSSDPPDGDLYRYDVQYKDGANGEWTMWRSKKEDPSATFYGELGHVYYFRARAWAKYEDGITLYGPYSTGTYSTIVGNVMSGKVDRLDGWPYPGATVSVTGAGTASTTSDADGNYTLPIPSTGCTT